MLQFFREKLQGYIVWLIVGLIVIVFVLGAGSYLFHRSYNDTLAKVDGENISLSIVNQQYQNIIKQHYSKKNYNNFDLNPQKLKQQIFNDLLNHVAIFKGLERNGFDVVDEELLSIVKSNRNLQVNGKFSREKYLNWLNKLGIHELEYQKLLKQQVLIEQFKNIILLSNFLPMEDLEYFLLKWFQTRKIGYVIVPKSKFVKPTILASEIEAYYTENKKDLLTPETIKIQYLDLSANKLIEKISPNREQLYKYYLEHPEYYTLPELVNIRHILVKFKDKDQNSQSAAKDLDPAKSKIDDILNKLKAGGNFKELAKKFSEDQTSAVKGGDLGWIGKNEIDIEFSNAAFSLNKPDQFSEIVKSKFGYHIIQLIEKRENKLSKFEDILDKVTQHYKEEEIQPKIQELYEKLTDAAANNTDLELVSKSLELPLQVTADFSSRGESNGIASYGEVVSAAFEQKHLNRNSDIIRIADDHFVLFRVIERKPIRNKTLLESSDEIKKILEDRKIAQQATQYTEDLALKLVKSKDASKVAKSNNLDWKVANVTRNNNSITPEVIRSAFELPQAKTQKIFNLANGDFLILQLLEIKDPDLSKILAEQPDFKVKMQEQLIQLQSYIEQKLYEQELYNTAKIKLIKQLDQV